MLLSSLFTVLLATWLAVGSSQTASGLLLNTTLCEGLFDFQVNSTLLAETEADMTSYETLVSFFLSVYPVWITEECTYNLRKIDCMTSYESGLGFEYCASDCSAALSTCSEFLTVLEGIDATAYGLIATKCDALTDGSGCESGGAMRSLASDETVCPLPLVEDVVKLPIESYQRYTTIPGSNCATPGAPVPMPYVESNWDGFRAAQLVICSLSLVSCVAVFWLHYDRKAGLDNLIAAYAISFFPAVCVYICVYVCSLCVVLFLRCW